MSKLSGKLERYADIQRAMENLRLTGGGFLLFERMASAIHWRHRAYKWRNLLADHMTIIYAGIDPEKQGKTAFDDMLLRVEEIPPVTSGDKTFTARVVVSFRELEQPPIFDPDGKPLAVKSMAVEVDHGEILPIELEVKP